ncbi:MAG: hypothetical protein K2Z81_09720 [Cyanobacteria bacterium]|nr:hypothetical protein [Cyanobacteriota bacterium]
MYICRAGPNKRNRRNSVLLRESVRVGKRFKKRTLANLTTWSEERLAVLEEALQLRRTAETRQEREEAAALIANLVDGYYSRLGPLPLLHAVTRGHYHWFGKEPWRDISANG